MKSHENQTINFPDVELADEDGLLFVGGRLSVANVLKAYHSGIFPWFQEYDGVYWYCPNPRFVLYPEQLKVSKSMQQLLKRNAFQVTYNQCFKEVVFNCSEVNRLKHGSTWIDQDFIDTYFDIYKKGYALSVEVWQNNALVGGLYGLKIGKVFFGESMFSIVSNASKYGFICLVNKLLEDKTLKLIDCQTYSSHLESLGAKFISRKKFISAIRKLIQ